MLIMDLNQNAIEMLHWEKNAIESIVFLSESMYIIDSNQCAIELVIYLLVLVIYFYELIVYMLSERNALDSIAFFSQCSICIISYRIFFWTNNIHAFDRNTIDSIALFSQCG